MHKKARRVSGVAEEWHPVRLIFFIVYFLLLTFYSIFANRIGIYGAENPGLYTE